MSVEHGLDSPIARFGADPDLPAWPEPRSIDALLRECVRLLFALCRADYRAWLSESDLQGMLYAILRREMPAHGLPASAVHLNYPCKLSAEHQVRLNRRTSTVPVDLILVAPHTITLLAGRRWEAPLAAAVELKRGYERFREIRDDLAKLAAIRTAWPNALTYMVIMGYHSRQEEIAAIQRTAHTAQITLLADNYWQLDGDIQQPHLV